MKEPLNGKETFSVCSAPLKAGFFDGPDALGANVVAASLANLDTWCKFAQGSSLLRSLTQTLHNAERKATYSCTA